MTSDQLRSAGLARRSYLMCPPRHFEVTYQINPWMQPDAAVDATRALSQWTRLHDELIGLGHAVAVMPPQPKLPDLVFTANGGIVIDDRALVPRFKYEQRAPEAEYFATALENLGLSEVHIATQINEGEGDFRLVGRQILAGYGLRSDRQAAAEVAEFFQLPVVPLRLVDPRFYHLDTALAVLDERTVAYWPGAFDAPSLATLQDLFPDAIISSEAEAALLGLNMVSDGQTVIMAPGCPSLTAAITERGFAVVPLASDELRKAGGGVKCCVLERHSTEPEADSLTEADEFTGRLRMTG